MTRVFPILTFAEFMANTLRLFAECCKSILQTVQLDSANFHFACP